MHLLQVCNVGQIVGGTAACAWSVTRALPRLRHSIVFLSRIDDSTRQVFQPHDVAHWPQCTADRIERINPDLVLLHNVSPAGASVWSGALTVQYVHSVGHRLAADETIYCSRWLAGQCRASTAAVLWQGVPLPPPPAAIRPQTTGRLRIGRICTPTLRKWPDTLPEFYSQLARRHPQVDWDFVGCPGTMQPPLLAACEGRATFLPAGWLARSHVWEWDALLYHHPSLTESFGRTVAEAARAGCIPIVDQRGGFVEQLEALGVSGCHAWPDFSHAISAITDPDTRRRTAESIRQRANEQFSLAAFGQRMHSLIDKWAGTRGG